MNTQLDIKHTKVLPVRTRDTLYKVSLDHYSYLASLLKSNKSIQRKLLVRKSLISKYKSINVFNLHVKATLSNTYVTLLNGRKVIFMSSGGRIGFKEKDTKRLPGTAYALGERFAQFFEKIRKEYNKHEMVVYRTGSKKTFHPFFKCFKQYLRRYYLLWKKKLALIIANLIRMYWRYLFLVMQFKARKKQRVPLRKVTLDETFSFMDLLGSALGHTKTEQKAEPLPYPIYIGSEYRLVPKRNSQIKKEKASLLLTLVQKRSILRLLKKYKKMFNKNIRPIRILFVRSLSVRPYNGCKQRWRRAIRRYW